MIKYDQNQFITANLLFCLNTHTYTTQDVVSAFSFRVANVVFACQKGLCCLVECCQKCGHYKSKLSITPKKTS